MKILLIMPTEYGSQNWGGVTTYTLSLAHELQKLGASVHVLCPGNVREVNNDSAIPVHKIPHAKIFINRVVQKFFPLFSDRLEWMMAVRQFVRINNVFDVIEAPEWASSTLLIPKKHQRIIVRLHKSLLQYYQDNGFPITPDILLINLLEMLAITLASGITSPTNYMFCTHKIVMKISRIRKIPYQIIPNGVPLKIQPSKRRVTKPYLLTVGRLEKGKGLLTLIGAFSQIAKKFPRIQLVLIGRDTKVGFKELLWRKIDDLKLTNRVLILPQLSQQELAPYYQHCLFYVLPSLGHENHPIALLDALRWRKAVVAHRTGGIPEIIHHGENGLLYENDDVNDLARNLEHLLKNPSKRRQFERLTRKRRKAFDIRIAAKQTLSFYRNQFPLL